MSSQPAPSWGSWKVHAVLLVLTFGTGNVAYGVYCRYLRSSSSDSGSELSSEIPYHSIADLDASAQEELAGMILDEESFVLGVRATDGVRKSKKTRWLLTTRRVIAMKEGTLSEEVRDIPLSKISTVEYDQGVTTEVSFSGSGVDEEFYTVPEQGKAFTQALRKELARA